MKNKYLEFSPFFFVEKENLYLLRLVPIFGAVAPDLFARDQGRLSHFRRILRDWKLLPLCNNNTGMEKEKKTIDGDGEKMRMEKRKKREEETDARSMNQLGGMSNKILISLVNYLPVISLRIVPSFSFSFPILVPFIFQFSSAMSKKIFSCKQYKYSWI